MAEAYESVADLAQKAGESPLIDDNGDGLPGSFGSPSYSTKQPGKDSYVASLFSLAGHRAHTRPR